MLKRVLVLLRPCVGEGVHTCVIERMAEVLEMGQYLTADMITHRHELVDDVSHPRKAILPTVGCVVVGTVLLPCFDPSLVGSEPVSCCTFNLQQVDKKHSLQSTLCARIVHPAETKRLQGC